MSAYYSSDDATRRYHPQHFLSAGMYRASFWYAYTLYSFTLCANPCFIFFFKKKAQCIQQSWDIFVLKEAYPQLLTNNAKKSFINIFNRIFTVIDTFEDYPNFQLLYNNQIRSLNTIPKPTIVSTLRGLLLNKVQESRSSIQ